MNLVFPVLLAITTAIFDPPSRDSAPAKPAVQAEQGDADEGGGVWPTKRMVENLMKRWVREAEERYELDADQTRQLEALVYERVPAFMREHRKVMQPLINEFFEATLDPDPPSVEEVKSWADRAMPLFQTFQESIKESNARFRATLKPQQQAKFDTDQLAMGIGMQMFETQLKGWQRGEFDGSSWGAQRARERQRRDARQRELLARRAAASQPSLADEILVELDAWDRYVADFIAAYSLDDAQRTSAESILVELKARAKEIRERNRERLDEIEKALATAEGEQKQKLTDELVGVYQPIDDIFAELKNRLDKLPTAAQRAAGGKPPEGGR